MKKLLILCLLSSLLAGCKWTPERDNSLDPKSPFYSPLPPNNRAPSIDSAWVNSDCRRSLRNDFCAFIVSCRISDPDDNLLYDSVMLRVDTLDFGKMYFNPESRDFSLRISQNEFPNDNYSPYLNRAIWIKAVDDSLGVDSAVTLFLAPLTDPWPELSHPVSFFDTQRVENPTLAWRFWINPDGPHTFAVSVYDQYQFLVWDTAGLPASDTSVVVSERLIPSNLDPGRHYQWFVTVKDVLGNRVSSLPGEFKIFILSRSLRLHTF
jgi:hypothetical protein